MNQLKKDISCAFSETAHLLLWFVFVLAVVWVVALLTDRNSDQPTAARVPSTIVLERVSATTKGACGVPLSAVECQ